MLGRGYACHDGHKDDLVVKVRTNNGIGINILERIPTKLGSFPCRFEDPSIIIHVAGDSTFLQGRCTLAKLRQRAV